GVLLLSDTGAAGFISVRATGGGSSGTGILTINSTGVDIDTVVTVGGRTIPITIAAGIGTDPRVDFTLAEGVLDVGGFVTITGSLTFTNRTVGERSARVVGAQGVTVFLGSSPALLPSGAPNPLAVGVLLSNATIGLVE